MCAELCKATRRFEQYFIKINVGEDYGDLLEINLFSLNLDVMF